VKFLVRLVLNWKILEIVTRFNVTLSAIGCSRTHWYMKYDSFISVTRLIRTYYMTHSDISNDSSIHVTWTCWTCSSPRYVMLGSRFGTSNSSITLMEICAILGDSKGQPIATRTPVRMLRLYTYIYINPFRYCHINLKYKYVCVCISIHMGIYICIYICIYIWLYICIHICIYIHVYIHIYIYIGLW